MIKKIVLHDQDFVFCVLYKGKILLTVDSTDSYCGYGRRSKKLYEKIGPAKGAITNLKKLYPEDADDFTVGKLILER